MSMRRTLTIACCAFALTVPVLSACSASVSVGDKTVDKDKVAEQVSTQLTEQVGSKPDSVECPEDLDAKVGATLTCTLTHDGENYFVDVTVTSVDGDDVKFDIESYQIVDKNTVAEEVSAQLTEQVGSKPDSVECPEDLDGKVGATLTCTLTHDGVSYDVDVTVTSVDAGNVKFDIAVADEPK